MENKDVFQKKAYDPQQYFFLGFFLSLVPVFFMSIKNSAVLRNGEKIKANAKKFLLIYILIYLFLIGLDIWSTIVVAKELTSASVGQALLNNPSLMSDLMVGDVSRLVANNPTIDFAKKVVDYASMIAVGLNLALLAIYVSKANKIETSVFKEMKEAKEIGVKGLGIPVLIGFAFVLANYFLLGEVVVAIAGLFV